MKVRPEADFDPLCRKRCGNGVREGSEECDDGRNDGTYGTCQKTCKLADYCGDAKKNGPEQCDLGKDKNEVTPYGAGKCRPPSPWAPDHSR